MKTLTRRIALLAALLIVGLPSTAAANGAQGFVQAKQGELAELLKKGKSAAVEQKVQTVFDTMLDYETLARRSLHKHWEELTEAQRKEFQQVLKQLVQNAYRKNLDKTLAYEVKFQGEAPADGGTLVRTVAKHRDNAREQPVSIDYVLHKVDGQWRVFDIVTEGSSLVRNYRSQLHRVIDKKGFEELLRRMKNKLAKES